LFVLKRGNPAEIAQVTAVLHTWGSALTHHPHAHIIVPGGGFSPDRRHWIACRPGFFLSVRVLSRLFRRLFLERLTAAYQAGRLEFFADQAFSAASVLSSSAPISREYPTTSAARIAASRRSTRSSLKGPSRRRPAQEWAA
jgi:hypothetical protein